MLKQLCFARYCCMFFLLSTTNLMAGVKSPNISSLKRLIYGIIEKNFVEPMGCGSEQTARLMIDNRLTNAVDDLMISQNVYLIGDVLESLSGIVDVPFTTQKVMSDGIALLSEASGEDDFPVLHEIIRALGAMSSDELESLLVAADTLLNSQKFKEAVLNRDIKSLLKQTLSYLDRASHRKEKTHVLNIMKHFLASASRLYMNGVSPLPAKETLEDSLHKICDIFEVEGDKIEVSVKKPIERMLSMVSYKDKILGGNFMFEKLLPYLTSDASLSLFMRLTFQPSYETELLKAITALTAPMLRADQNSAYNAFMTATYLELKRDDVAGVGSTIDSILGVLDIFFESHCEIVMAYGEVAHINSDAVERLPISLYNLFSNIFTHDKADKAFVQGLYEWFREVQSLQRNEACGGQFALGGIHLEQEIGHMLNLLKDM